MVFSLRYHNHSIQNNPTCVIQELLVDHKEVDTKIALDVNHAFLSVTESIIFRSRSEDTDVAVILLCNIPDLEHEFHLDNGCRNSREMYRCIKCSMPKDIRLASVSQ